MCFLFFFFNDTATTEIYTLSLHDALPILFMIARVTHHVSRITHNSRYSHYSHVRLGILLVTRHPSLVLRDRKSTRLNSSHSQISYAVFCLKKKKKLYRLHTPLLHRHPTRH